MLAEFCYIVDTYNPIHRLFYLQYYIIPVIKSFDFMQKRSENFVQKNEVSQWKLEDENEK